MVGVILNFVLVFTSLNLGYDEETIVTILPRSITAAVGIEVSQDVVRYDYSIIHYNYRFNR